MVFVADHTKSEEIADIQKKLGMTMPKLAERLGVKLTRLQNWVYGKSNAIPEDIMARARALVSQHDIGPFSIPASQLLIPIPYLGMISASSPVDWTDPFESDILEYVPPEMGDPRGRFSCRVDGDSMYDLLWPNDLVVFHRDDIPRIGNVIMFRSFENRITIKELKHNGKEFILHPINPSYEDVRAEGSTLGYLVGIVRQIGSKKVTAYDPNGIRPE